MSKQRAKYYIAHDAIRQCSYENLHATITQLYQIEACYTNFDFTWRFVDEF